MKESSIVIQSKSSKTLSGRKESKIEPLGSVNKIASVKIKAVDALSQIIGEHKENGKRIVQCHGVFDLVHLGHIRYFNAAKREGDVLVVSLTADKYVKRGPGRPLFNENLRAEALASLAVADYVCVVDFPTAVECIKAIRPDVYAKGPDYKDKDKDITGKILDEEEAVGSVGGRLVITEDITFSSSKLINDHLDLYPVQTRDYLKRLGDKYTIDMITDRMYSTEKLKILVIGDAIIDQYHYCEPMGKSSKEPIVANRYISEEAFAGGSLATACNVAAVCGNVDLVTVLGRSDSHESFIREQLSPNVNPMFFYREDAGTIIKRRYVTEGASRKLFEVCYIEDTDIPRSLEMGVLGRLEKIIGDYDLIIVNDFGHGLLTKALMELICNKSRYLALNVQTNSANIGFNLISKYPRANCVCIDETELRYAAHDKRGDLRTNVKCIHDLLRCEHLITTRGANGALSYSKDEGFLDSPALSYRVVDAIGAGDAFFAYVAPCFAAGLPQDMVSFIGNAVGSLAVQIVCNREPVKLEDLIKFITRLLK